MKHTYIVNQIQKMIDDGVFDKESKLPTLAMFSRKFGASPVTVLKALNELKTRGVVHSLRGGSYSLKPQQPLTDDTAAFARRSSAQTIADAMREEIISGEGGRVLASAKELATRHGCSHRTLRAALMSLARDGVIRRRGAGYVTVVPGVRPSEQTSVYFVGTQKALESAQGMGFVMGMEREIEARHWGGLEHLTGDDPESCRWPEGHRVAAYVHYCPDSTSSWEPFLHRHVSIPSVVVNMHEVVNTGHGMRRNFITIMPDNRRAGRELGQYCAARGHARCAYFSNITLEDGCARLRLEGLNEVYPCGSPGPKRSCRVFDGARVTADADPQTGKLNDGLDRIVHAVRGDSPLSPNFIADGFYDAYGVLHWWNRYTALHPLFEDAFADKSITAWICSDDSMAAIAHRFLAQKRAAGGRGVALGSFDNSQTSYSLGITSYDFGFDAMGRTAVHCLAAPHLMKLDRRNGLHLAGQLIARASTQD